MIKTRLLVVIFVTFLLQLGSIKAQQYWSIEENLHFSSKQFAHLTEYEVFRLDEQSLKTQLFEVTQADKNPSTKNIFAFPVGKDAFVNFELTATSVMESGLAEKYPQVETYRAIGVDNKSHRAHFDWTTSGFHGYIYTTKGELWIDPIKGETGLYVLYDRKSTERDALHACGTKDEHDIHSFPKNGASNIGTEMRTLRAAFATTGEFARAEVTGTSDPLEAVITMTNRMNLILERDLSLRVVLVADNDKIAFTDPSEDPYSNEAFEMLGENVGVLNDSIGFENYDIGHVFTANTRGGVGGVAFLGSICGDNKASGVSSFFGNANSFLGTLVHEVGHQLGGSHTWNRCGDDSSNQR
ncbi:MAG: zinc-dependent metalloprotease family protein, partial [Bacteroidota bacterium]